VEYNINHLALLVDQTRYSKLTSSEIVERQSINYMCIYNFLLHIKAAVKSLGINLSWLQEKNNNINYTHLICKQIKNWVGNLFDSEEFG